MGLLQRDVAAQIGVDKTTIHNWETHRSSPRVRHLPGIIDFLGYVPFPVDPGSFAEKLNTTRKALGLTQKAMADRLGVDPTTIRRWEGEKGRPSGNLPPKLERLFQHTTLNTRHGN